MGVEKDDAEITAVLAVILMLVLLAESVRAEYSEMVVRQSTVSTAVVTYVEVEEYKDCYFMGRVPVRYEGLRYPTTFQYEVDGKVCEGTAILYNEVVVGDLINIRYNPDNPADCSVWN